ATLRAASWLSFVASVVLLTTATMASGAIREASLSIGRQLEGLHDLLGDTKTALVNGQRIFVSTAVVPLDVRAVLDRFEQQCAAHPNALIKAIEGSVAAERLSQAPIGSAAPSTAPIASKPFGKHVRARLGILREEGERDGIVACLVQRQPDTRTPLELARELARTMDVSVLGDFFYTYAVKTKGSESHVVTTWTHGSFKPIDMFPRVGDAPGSDSALAVRPRDSRRVLSGVSVDAPYAIRVYESRDGVSETFATLDADMKGRRWTRAAEVNAVSHAYIHESGVQAVATLAHRDGRTIVSLAEMGAPVK
ncbi:MAG TPA: hypothetical protein VIV60_01400, partial [Polyangiaceae bacterium]